MNIETFDVPYGKYLLKGDQYRSEVFPNSTIMLHGAGKSSRATFSRMRAYLHAFGLPSVSFDFVGHGETIGSIHDSTLQGRTDQAALVIKHTCREPLTLIGASMGAYSAIKLTEFLSVRHLVLLVPAIYTPQAYEVPFGPEFSAIIRQPDSWENSDAFEKISNFHGNVVIMAAEFDEVIPRKLIEKLYASAGNAKKRHLHIVPNATHLSLFPDENRFRTGMGILLEVIKGR